MKTGLIIIHYNDYESLSNLIDNVKNYKCLDKIVIYDNHSKEEIRLKVEKLKSKNIDIIFNNDNKGYSYAINEASKYLVNKIGKCNIIISNSDIVINKEEDIKELVKLLDNKEIGLVAPIILENNNLNRGWKEVKPILDSLLNVILIHRPLRRKYVFYKEDHYKEKTSVVDVVSGCFFLIRSDILEKINYLDENVFLYYEENILAKKLKNINKKIIVDNEIIVIHNHSVSIDKNLKKINKLKIQKQSQYYYHVNYNHANIFEKTMLKVTTFVNRQILRIIYFIKDLKK